MNRLTELQLDLIEYKAYRELQECGDGPSEDVYFKMAIQSIERAIADYGYSEPQIKKSNKDRNRYRLNKKTKEKMYKSKEGWYCNPWKNHNKRGCPTARAKERKFKRKLRRIPVGKEEFSLRGCGYQDVYQWTWDVD